MERNSKRKISLGAIMLLFGIALILMVGALVTAMKPTAARLNNRGNNDYARQAYEEALVDYQKAQIDRPELAEPYYNAANALYRRGAYAEALDQLQVALSFAADAELAEKGFFNLGNNFFNQEQMEAAVSAFKEALLRNPADADAKYNLELALQTQEQQEQQEQEQEQQEQNEESQENQDGQQGEEEDQQDQEQGEEQQSANEEDSAGEENQEGDDQGNEAEQEQEQAEGDQNQGNNNGQPQNGQEEAAVPDGELTEDQATQLLNAIAAEAETLQEALGKIISGPPIPPTQDW